MSQYQIPTSKPQIDQGATKVQFSPVDGVKMEYQTVRQIPSVKLVPIQGATIQRTDPIPTVNQPIFQYYVRNTFSDITLPIFTAVAVVQTIPIPGVSLPEFAYYNPDINRYIWEGPDQFFDGATIQATIPIPPVSQPEYAYYKPEVNRYQDEVVKRFEGATVQRTDPIPFVNQPELRYNYTINHLITLGSAVLPIPGGVVTSGGSNFFLMFNF